MKKLLVVLFAFFAVTSYAQPWKTIKGNGQLKKETRTVADFSSLASRGAIDVVISYGDSKNITLEMDENILPYIETTVENDRLTIKPKSYFNINSKSRMVVRVSMNKITSLQQSGSGNISGEGSFHNDGKTEIGLSGSGDIKLGFDHFDDLSLSVSGSGNITLVNGKTGDLSAQVSGSGNIDCSRITSDDVTAKISGSGNVKVNQPKSIDAKIFGSGNVYYKGSVANVKSNIAGSGRLVKL